MSRPTRIGWFLGALAISGGLGFQARAEPPRPVLPQLVDAANRTPLILVPGIGGTKLREAPNGRVMWGNARSLFVPRDGGYRMALSTLPEPGAENILEPFEPVLQIRLLGLLKKEAYAPLLRLMQKNGYLPGLLEAPRIDDTFFFLNYDWRRSVVDAARQLGAQVEGVRDARGEAEIEVDLICQSTAGLLCRWLAKYGTATLEEAESGVARPLRGVRIGKLILLGTAGDGGIGVLEELSRGRRYLFGVGRRWRPEALFTYPSLYESLPSAEQPAFMDSAGTLLDVDILDPLQWERNGWGIFRPAVRKRLDRKHGTARFGDDGARREFLARMLDRARRLHRLLLADPPDFRAPRYYSLQGAYSLTPARAVLRDTGTGVATLYPDSRAIRRDPVLRALASEPGDGHATFASQDALSPAERAALVHAPARIGGSHFEFILSPATQRLLLQHLAD